MKLTSTELLRAYMEHRDFTQARLGRFAGCSRQFIWQLLNGQVATCTPEVARRIEEALGVIEGTLFTPSKSPQTRRTVPSAGTRSTKVA